MTIFCYNDTYSSTFKLYNLFFKSLIEIIIFATVYERRIARGFIISQNSFKFSPFNFSTLKTQIKHLLVLNEAVKLSAEKWKEHQFYERPFGRDTKNEALSRAEVELHVLVYVEQQVAQICKPGVPPAGTGKAVPIRQRERFALHLYVRLRCGASGAV